MNNPYQSAESNSVYSQPQSQNPHGGVEASQQSIQYLASSKGWVRFISVLGFIYFGFAVIGSFGVLITLSGISRGMGGAEMFVAVPLMLVFMALVFILSLRLSQYAGAIGRLINFNNSLDLEAAMVAQMKFWRLAGILTVIWIVMFILSFFVPALVIMQGM